MILPAASGAVSNHQMTLTLGVSVLLSPDIGTAQKVPPVHLGPYQPPMSVDTCSPAGWAA